MKPILLVHGYSSEGKDTDAPSISGSLPDDLRAEFGDSVVVELNLIRWISLSEGISIDDVSLAMDRALRANHPRLLEDGFHNRLNCVMVTGRGFPDLATRAFVSHLFVQFNLQVLG